MPLESTAALIDLLRSSRLLSPTRCAEMAALQTQFPDPRSLAHELLRRDWLTAYQINQLFVGRGAGLMWGQYVLLERLAEGGLAQVFKARHLRLGRLAALKLPRADNLTEEVLARARREARALALLNHPNTVTLYDAGEAGGRHFLALEFVEGPTLAHLVKQHGRLPAGQACAYARQAALGLQHLHEHGIVHRDVNPNNLVLAAKEGLVKVIGLGLCRLDLPPEDGAVAKSLTLPGAILGTADYIAPEQIENCHAADARADLYGLGCTLYHLLAGRPPFADTPLTAKLQKHLRESPPPLQEVCPDLPPELATVVTRLLARRPGERYPSAADAAAALAPFCRTDSPPAANAVLGQYQLLEQLGETHMSQVFKARDLRLGRVVALKVLHDTLLADPDAVARFQREARAAALLKHPNVALLYDAGEVDGQHFLVMEYVEGRSLLKLVKEGGALPVAPACAFIRQAALGLQHLHERGVIHRDVSPANLIATADDTVVKLIDLGLARLERPPRDVSTEEPRTLPGRLMGTPDFVAPEQADDAHRADRRSDVYALGCTLYYLLAGHPPFPGGTVGEKIYRHQTEQPDPVEGERAGVPAGLAAVVRKLMAKAPDERYQTAAQVAGALAPFCTPEQSPAGTQTVRPSEPAAPVSLNTLAHSVVVRQSPKSQPVSESSILPTGCGTFPGVPAYTAPEEAAATARPAPPPSRAADRPAERLLLFPPQPWPRRIARGVANLLRRAAQRWRRFRSRSGPKKDLVDCTVFAPPAVAPGETVFVQVFAHLPEAAATARQLAQEFDASAERRAFRSLSAEVARGATLTFHLALGGLTVDDPVQALVWRGRPEPVSFGVAVPRDRPPGTLVGTVTVSLDSVPVGHIKFKLTVTFPVLGDRPPQPVALGDAAHRYRKAFISYASKDRTEVLKRVQMLRSLRIGFFQDLLDLEPGDRWERQLYRHIDDSDLFLLFWSNAARESRWVLEEVRYALKRKGGDDAAPPSILPVILEGPPPPEPPAELAHLHFADYLVYFMKID